MTQAHKGTAVISSRISAPDFYEFHKLCRTSGTTPCAAVRNFILDCLRRESTELPAEKTEVREARILAPAEPAESGRKKHDV